MAEVISRHPVADLGTFLCGLWALRRDIFDAEGAAAGSFLGAGQFRSGPHGLDYREQGVLRMGTHRGRAYRRLRYVPDGPGRATVYFDYGEFFHELDLRSGRWQTHHPCRDDEYRGLFEVWGPHEWEQTWVVAGPRKNHTLRTRLRRVQLGQRRRSA